MCMMSLVCLSGNEKSCPRGLSDIRCVWCRLSGNNWFTLWFIHKDDLDSFLSHLSNKSTTMYSWQIHFQRVALSTQNANALHTKCRSSATHMFDSLLDLSYVADWESLLRDIFIKKQAYLWSFMGKQHMTQHFKICNVCNFQDCGLILFMFRLIQM